MIAQEQNNVAATCVKQIGACFKKIDWQTGSTNLDIGGGKYDLATDFVLNKYSVRNLVYDPFNRSKVHNDTVLLSLLITKPDTITISNVLCVIEEQDIRRDILEFAASYNVPVYITVYEGNKSGIPKISKRGTFQWNRKLKDYLGEVQEFFSDVKIQKGMIVAKNG